MKLKMIIRNTSIIKNKYLKIIFFYVYILIVLFTGFIVLKLTIYYDYKPANLIYTRNATINDSNKFKYLESKFNCSPIKEDKQYFVTIDDVVYPKRVQLFKNQTINFECLNKNDKIKKILLWNSFFGDESFSLGLGVRTPFINQKCPVTNCELLSNKSRINESDFVLVHMRDPMSEPPQYRPADQRWVLVLYESAYFKYFNFTQFNGFFNLTSTYHSESDFPGFYENYADMIWAENREFDENFDYHKYKTGFAVAVISNCFAPSNRLEYIAELQKYIPVQVFGKCGDNCTEFYKNGTNGSCKEIVAAEYKFYLAFENSVCKDYITEKFFQILKYNIIPVVLGGGLYTDYVIIIIFVLMELLKFMMRFFMIILDSEICFYRCI